MQQAHLITTTASGLEAWITWDESAQVYELWASSDCDDYIGCADTRAEALKVAYHWFDDRESY
jgi:hypothetical protein